MGTAAASSDVYGRPDAGRPATRRARTRLGTWRLVVTGLLAAVVTTLVCGALVAAGAGRLAVDFRLVYEPAARAVLHGHSPYDTSGYVYPPQLAFVLAPLGLLPDDIAAFVAILAVASLLIATLAVLGVRDPLCYLAAFLWAPTWQEFDMASVTAALGFALALVWRYRGRVWLPTAALGLAVPAKVFLWPLFVWTLATRRVRVTVGAVALGAGITIALWAFLGFDGLAHYPTLLWRLNAVEARRGYSLAGITSSLGLGQTVGNVSMIAFGVALIAGCVALARRGDEQRSFILAIGAALMLTPILWLHYFVLLLVTLAIARPRFSAIWLLPLLPWLGPTPMHPTGYATALPELVFATVICLLVAPPGARLARPRARAFRAPRRDRARRRHATLA